VDPSSRRLRGLRLTNEGRDAMAIVGPGNDEMNLRDLPRRLEEVVDPFPGSDPPDVKGNRRLCGDPELGSQVAVSGGSLFRGREAVAAYVHLLRPKPVCNDSLALAFGRDDHSGRPAANAAVERGVQGALQCDLAQARLEHPERLEDVRNAREPVPRCRPGRHRIPKSEDVHDIGTR
jgi:hypothetical protein